MVFHSSLVGRGSKTDNPIPMVARKEKKQFVRSARSPMHKAACSAKWRASRFQPRAVRSCWDGW